MNDDVYLARLVRAFERYGIELSEVQGRSLLDLLPSTPNTEQGLKVQANSLIGHVRWLMSLDLKHTEALEIIARLYGHRNLYGAQKVLQSRIPPYDPRNGWTVTLPFGHPPFVDESAFFSRVEERAEIPDAMYEAFVSYFNRRLTPVDWARAALEGHVDEAIVLAGPDGRHVRPLVRLAEYYSWQGAFGSPKKVAAYLAQPYGTFVPVGNFNVGAALAALYNVAEPVDHGYATFDVTPMTIAQGADEYERWFMPSRGDNPPSVYVDYVGYTRMKVMFERTGWINVEHFEDGRLPGIAAYALDVARESRVNDPRILAVRQLLLLKTGERNDISLATPFDDPELTETGRHLLALLHRAAPAFNSR